MNVIARDIRAKLMNPPVKATKEEVIDLQQRLRAQVATNQQLQRDNLAKQQIIDNLLIDLRAERDLVKSMELGLKAMEDSDEPITSDGKPSIKSIIGKELRDWPGVTWGEIKGQRKSWHIVQARRQCVLAVYQQRPDLPLQEIGRIFNKDHSTICHAVYKGNEVIKKSEMMRRTKAAQRGEA